MNHNPFRLRIAARLAAVVASLLSCLPLPAGEGTFNVRIDVDVRQPLGEMKPIWRFFGADEPNYATMKDGRKLLSELGSLGSHQVYFRAHNLLTSGDGTPALKWGSTGVYEEDAAGKAVYDWKVIDRIFDTYLERGVRPYAQIGFMPRDLSRRPDPYQHAWRPGLPYQEVYTGWAQPPKDINRWQELVYQWAAHCVNRYGRAEVERWYWETWNEANIGYWQGTREEFFELHDHAVTAVRRALPTARVGGPDCAGFGGGWMRAFLDHCLRGTNAATGEVGTPLDFVSFHAKGAPVFTNGHVRMGMAQQLQEIDRGFALLASYPELHGKPVIIGESDPEGCAACQGPQLAYRNGTMYSSYTAASFARKHDLAARHHVNLEGALTWAFEFEDQPYFAGFRALASCGINLPVLNVFRLFGRMGGQRILAESSGAVPLDDILKSGVRGRPDVAALASSEERRVAVMVWHYHDDDVAGPGAEVVLGLAHLPLTSGVARLAHYRIDEEHGNAYGAWKRMGSPLAPTRPQYEALLAASQLTKLSGAPGEVKVEDGAAVLRFALPRQAVSLVLIEWD